MTRPAAAVLDEVDLTHYPEGFLGCRDMRHAWGRQPVYWVTPFGEKRRILRCLACGTLRHDKQHGRPSYEYPEGYRIEQRVDRQEFREEAYRRGKVYKTEDSALKALLGGTTSGEIVKQRTQRQRTAQVIDLRTGGTRTRNNRRKTQTARRRKAVSA